MISLSELVRRLSQSLGGLLQVQLSVTCHLVTPKQVVPGSLKIMPSLLHFCGAAALQQLVWQPRPPQGEPGSEQAACLPPGVGFAMQKQDMPADV